MNKIQIKHLGGCIRKLLVMLLSLIAFSNLFAQTTINIPTDYSTIQEGLNVANEGDTVFVAAGVYTENIIWPETNGIALVGQDSSNTIIDGAKFGRVVTIERNDSTSMDTSTIIQGFKIAGGGTNLDGGGMLLNFASPKLSLLSITNNQTTSNGGGIYLNRSSPTMTNVNIYSNSANSGGGMYLYDSSSPIMTNINFFSNSSGSAGGMFLRDSDPTLTNVSFFKNSASGAPGGGMLLYDSNPTLTNISFFQNSSGMECGGMYLQDSNPTLTNVVFLQNSAEMDCGGMFLGNSNPILTNVKFFQNSSGTRGGGVYVGPNSIPVFIDVVIYDNIAPSGGGMYIGGNFNFFEGLSIFNNRSNIGGGIYINGGKPIIKFSNIINNYSSEQGSGIYVNYNGDIIIDSCNINSTNYSIYNNSASIIIAANNWFGDASGPYHGTYNTTGKGDSVSIYVDIRNWLTEPNIDAPPIPVQNLSVQSTTDTEISLKWDKSLIGDLDGYKVYYDTDSTNWEFSNSIDVGLDTNYTISNLPIGQTYYISVTCYDTDGNESWYSETVSANTTPVPIISINFDEINFGSVTIEKESSFNLAITNIGTEVLTVFSSQTTTDFFYTNQAIELNISPNETVQLPVYFKPLVIGEYHDELTISSNANNEPQIVIQLNGVGVLPEAPTILSIADVPNDQGGNARIEFSKSRYDQNGDTTYSIASYSVWRLNTDSGWDAIGMFNADRSEKYNFVSATLGDSTVDGIIWSVFKISAHSVNPDVFYYSDIDSGYSIDNIAPSVPQGLNAVGFSDRVEIAWNSNKEKDFQYFAIYRSTDSEFNPDTMRTYTLSTIDSIYIDNDVNYGIQYYYIISAFDYAGNESEYTESVSALVTDIEENIIIPKEYVLYQNYPNPFNPSTMVKYGLPEQSNVKIEIFDMLGQNVGVLVNTEKSTGFYEATWNAENLPSGIYLISIRAVGLSSKKNFTQVKKALLLK